MSDASASPVSRLPVPRRMIAVILLAPVVAAIALWAAGWSGARLAPRDLPIGVAGPRAATTPLERALDAREGAFDVHRYTDEAAAKDAIKDREVYGAVVATPQGPKLLTASAAGPVVAQMLSAAVAQQAPQGAPVPTEDVVPAPSADPRGAALSGSVLPLAIAGIGAGALVTLLQLRGVRAAGALIGAATLVGVVGAAIAGSWLDVITGNWWAEAAALALVALAIGSAVAGLAALIGPPGIGAVAMLIMLIGNPFSGVSSAPQLLPEPAGLIGQLMPPGAGASLVRSVAFFDGNGGGGPALTLGIWTVLGLLGVALGARRATRSTTATAAADRELTPVGSVG
ncbi:hypothetical protein ACZ90_03370 [Streptomyces albus subsp. albus]|nr:hypothetical protein ACZ90_03370 [Streptomyces albus subsp. albus]